MSATALASIDDRQREVVARLVQLRRESDAAALAVVRNDPAAPSTEARRQLREAITALEVEQQELAAAARAASVEARCDRSAADRTARGESVAVASAACDRLAAAARTLEDSLNAATAAASAIRDADEEARLAAGRWLGRDEREQLWACLTIRDGDLRPALDGIARAFAGGGSQTMPAADFAELIASRADGLRDFIARNVLSSTNGGE